MAGTTSITIRLPNDVLAALDHQGGKRTDALIAVLRTWMAGGSAATPDPRVAELETALAGQKALTEKWRKAAQAAMPMTDAVATKRVRDPDPMGRHQSGPVYEPRLAVQGTAQPRFRPGTTADKAIK